MTTWIWLDNDWVFSNWSISQMVISQRQTRTKNHTKKALFTWDKNGSLYWDIFKDNVSPTLVQFSLFHPDRRRSLIMAWKVWVLPNEYTNPPRLCNFKLDNLFKQYNILFPTCQFSLTLALALETKDFTNIWTLLQFDCNVMLIRRHSTRGVDPRPPLIRKR